MLSLKGNYLCDGRGETGRLGEAFVCGGERICLWGVSGELMLLMLLLGNSRRKDGGGSAGVEMSWSR